MLQCEPCPRCGVRVWTRICTKCRHAAKVRAEFGKGDVADQWIALFDPEVLEQEAEQDRFRNATISKIASQLPEKAL